MLPRPALFGHRGAAAERPENTLASFRRALEVGADALETDVHVTADGHVVIAHDPDGTRMAGVAQAVRDLTLEQIQRWDVGTGFVAPDGSRPFRGAGHTVPTLDQALSEFPGVSFNVDIKAGPAAAARVVAAVRRARATDRVLLTSFSSRVLAAVRHAGYEGETGLGRNEAVAFVLAPVALLRARPLAGRAAQLPTRLGPLSLTTRRTIERGHALGLRVDFWTVNDLDQARAILDLGADGIVSDDPAKLRPLFTERRAR